MKNILFLMLIRLSWKTLRPPAIIDFTGSIIRGETEKPILDGKIMCIIKQAINSGEQLYV